MGLEDIDALNTSLKLIQSFLTSLAIIVGGVWAYLNFVKGRVYHSKLELGISMEMSHVDDANTNTGTDLFYFIPVHK